MKESQKGEIFTALAIGAFIVITATSIATSLFGNKAPQTTKTQAATTCVRYPTITGRDAPPAGYYWEADCDNRLGFLKQPMCSARGGSSGWCVSSNECNQNIGNPDSGNVNTATSNFCYTEFGDRVEDQRCMMLRYSGTCPAGGSCGPQPGFACGVQPPQSTPTTQPGQPTPTRTPGGVPANCNDAVEEVFFDKRYDPQLRTRTGTLGRNRADCYVRVGSANMSIGCYVRNNASDSGLSCEYRTQVNANGKVYYKFDCYVAPGYNESMMVAGMNYGLCQSGGQYDWTKARYWARISDPPPAPPENVAPAPGGGSSPAPTVPTSPPNPGGGTNPPGVTLPPGTEPTEAPPPTEPPPSPGQTTLSVSGKVTITGTGPLGSKIYIIRELPGGQDTRGIFNVNLQNSRTANWNWSNALPNSTYTMYAYMQMFDGSTRSSARKVVRFGQSNLSNIDFSIESLSVTTPAPSCTTLGAGCKTSGGRIYMCLNTTSTAVRYLNMAECSADYEAARRAGGNTGGLKCERTLDSGVVSPMSNGSTYCERNVVKKCVNNVELTQKSCSSTEVCETKSGTTQCSPKSTVPGQPPAPQPPAPPANCTPENPELVVYKLSFSPQVITHMEALNEDIFKLVIRAVNGNKEIATPYVGTAVEWEGTNVTVFKLQGVDLSTICLNQGMQATMYLGSDMSKVLAQSEIVQYNNSNNSSHVFSFTQLADSYKAEVPNVPVPTTQFQTLDKQRGDIQARVDVDYTTDAGQSMDIGKLNDYFNYHTNKYCRWVHVPFEPDRCRTYKSDTGPSDLENNTILHVERTNRPSCVNINPFDNICQQDIKAQTPEVPSNVAPYFLLQWRASSDNQSGAKMYDIQNNALVPLEYKIVVNHDGKQLDDRVLRVFGDPNYQVTTQNRTINVNINKKINLTAGLMVYELKFEGAAIPDNGEYTNFKISNISPNNNLISYKIPIDEWITPPDNNFPYLMYHDREKEAGIQVRLTKGPDGKWRGSLFLAFGTKPELRSDLPSNISFTTSYTCGAPGRQVALAPNHTVPDPNDPIESRRHIDKNNINPASIIRISCN